MFDQFPKKRIELPTAYQKIYLAHYKKNRAGATPATFFSNKLERWLHKKAAADSKTGAPKTTLEIGAGTLNHLPYERYASYDIVEPFQALYKESSHLDSIHAIYTDIKEIPLTRQYERVISIANFEHILDLPFVVAKTCLHLTEKGCLRVAIPNEGTLLWWLAYNLTTGVEFRLKYGLAYSVLMKYEHVNSAREIESVLNYFFKKNTCFVLGLSKQFALYRFYECRGPEKNRALAFLNAGRD